jgi:hypothetical protein
MIRELAWVALIPQLAILGGFIRDENDHGGGIVSRHGGGLTCHCRR